MAGMIRICPGGPGTRAGTSASSPAQRGRKHGGSPGEGIDTLITGEGPHWTYALAEEVGINILYGGHYATETFAVKTLAAHVGQRFELPWDFIDLPTGL